MWAHMVGRPRPGLTTPAVLDGRPIGHHLLEAECVSLKAQIAENIYYQHKTVITLASFITNRLLRWKESFHLLHKKDQMPYNTLKVTFL